MARGLLLIGLTLGAGLVPNRAVAQELPEKITYRGVDRLPDGTPVWDWTMKLTVSNGAVSGTVVFTPLKGQVGPANMKISGRVRDGHCLFYAGGLDLEGPCDVRRFSGKKTGSGEYFGTFDFRNTDLISSRGRTYAEATEEAQQPRRSSLPGMELPAGNWDYVEGKDIPDEQERSSQGGGAASDNAPDGMDTPPGTMWNYGRHRWVIQPGGNCPPAAQLLKRYCFGAVMAYLRQHPKDTKVTAITLSRPTPIGTWISNDTPIRYMYVEVRHNKQTDKIGRAHV
jgi:hypothetical protein